MLKNKKGDDFFHCIIEEHNLSEVRPDTYVCHSL